MKLPLNRACRSGSVHRGATGRTAETPCEAIWDLLSLYADQEASSDEAAMVESHIAVCVDCARDLAFMRSTHATFSTVQEVAPPTGLRSAILAATAQRPSMGQRLSDTIHRLLAPAPARYGFAVAAGLAGILVAVGIHRGMGPLGDLSQNPAAYRPGPKIAATAPAPHPLDAEDLGFERTPATPRAIARPPLMARLRGDSERTAVPVGAISQVIRRSGKGVLAAAMLKSSAKSPAVTLAAAKLPQPMQVAGGEMKLKSPIVEAKPNSTEDDGLRTADMMVTAEPSPAKPTSQPLGTTPGKEPEAVVAPAVSPRLSRFVLTSASTPDTVGQIASFADLKRSLKNSDLDGAKAIEQSIRAGQIRVPVLKKSF